VRILVTNDDGVHAPGLAAMVQALARWAKETDGHEIVVVAPLENHSGASAAVGTVFERQAVDFHRVSIEGAEEIPTYGLDASPALSVIIGAFGAFGPKPDLVVSGINLGVNVGRSILHSGTVGAALTGTQYGLRGLAVSMRSLPEPHQWETASAVAISMIPVVSAAPPRTVFNLNVPAVPLHQLRGVVSARISDAGIVQGAHAGITNGDAGSIELVLGTAVPSLGDTSDEGPSEDGALIAAGYASLTALRGVGEDGRPETQAIVERAIKEAHRLLAF
jgi:5'-nucleotidase